MVYIILKQNCVCLVNNPKNTNLLVVLKKQKNYKTDVCQSADKTFYARICVPDLLKSSL